jgi:hypothetical protein
MSNFTALTKHPETGEIKPAYWMDNFWGKHQYGVVFTDDNKRAFKGEMCEQVHPVDIPKELKAIGENIRTQDNRATDAPMFIVQQKKRIWGVDSDCSSDFVWVNVDADNTVANESEAAILDQLEAEHKEVPDGWDRAGFVDTWEFVTACFTERGCEDYIKANGHNLNEPRIYAAGSYRNEEFRSVREILKGLQ